MKWDWQNFLLSGEWFGWLVVILLVGAMFGMGGPSCSDYGDPNLHPPCR